jgi:hypothetical protein
VNSSFCIGTAVALVSLYLFSGYTSCHALYGFRQIGPSEKPLPKESGRPTRKNQTKDFFLFSVQVEKENREENRTNSLDDKRVKRRKHPIAVQKWIVRSSYVHWVPFAFCGFTSRVHVFCASRSSCSATEAEQASLRVVLRN